MPLKVTPPPAITIFGWLLLTVLLRKTTSIAACGALRSLLAAWKTSPRALLRMLLVKVPFICGEGAIGRGERDIVVAVGRIHAAAWTRAVEVADGAVVNRQAVERAAIIDDTEILLIAAADEAAIYQGGSREVNNTDAVLTIDDVYVGGGACAVVAVNDHVLEGEVVYDVAANGEVRVVVDPHAGERHVLSILEIDPDAVRRIIRAHRALNTSPSACWRGECARACIARNREAARPGVIEKNPVGGAVGRNAAESKPAPTDRGAVNVERRACRRRQRIDDGRVVLSGVDGAAIGRGKGGIRAGTKVQSTCEGDRGDSTLIVVVEQDARSGVADRSTESDDTCPAARD